MIDDENGTGGYGLSLADGGTGSLRFYARGSSVIILDTPLNTIANNTWYFIAAVADIANGIRMIYVTMPEAINTRPVCRSVSLPVAGGRTLAWPRSVLRPIHPQNRPQPSISRAMSMKYASIRRSEPIGARCHRDANPCLSGYRRHSRWLQHL